MAVSLEVTLPPAYLEGATFPTSDMAMACDEGADYSRRVKILGYII